MTGELIFFVDGEIMGKNVLVYDHFSLIVTKEQEMAKRY